MSCPMVQRTGPFKRALLDLLLFVGLNLVYWDYSLLSWIPFFSIYQKRCNLDWIGQFPSGKLTFCYGKSPFLLGKPTISMAIFTSYVINYQRLNPIINPIKSLFLWPFSMTLYQRVSLHDSPVEESFGVDFNVSQPEIFRPTPDFRCKRFSPLARCARSPGWNSLETCGTKMIYDGIEWDLMGFNGISWDLMGFNGIEW